MTSREWVEVVAFVNGNWPHAPMPKTAVEVQAPIVADVAKDAALRAVAELARSGQPFPPTAGSIAAHLRGRGARPTPDEAVALLKDATGRVGCSIYAADFPERHQAAVNWLAAHDEVVAAFAARRGLCGPGSFGGEPLEDPEWGGVVKGRIEKDLADDFRQADERVKHGLPAVDARQLAVRVTTHDEGGGMAGLLERLRPEDEEES